MLHKADQSLTSPLISSEKESSRKADEASSLRRYLTWREDGHEVNNEQLETLHRLHREYKRKFLAPSRKAFLEKVKRTDCTKEEAEEYELLRNAHNKYKRITRGRKRPKRPEYTSSELDCLHEKYKTFNREFREKSGLMREKIAEIKANGSRAEIDWYEDLHDAHRKYNNWDRRERWAERKVNGKIPHEHTGNDVAMLNHHHDGYLLYAREYVKPPAGRKKAAQLRQGTGTDAELLRFNELRRHHTAFLCAYRKYYYPTEKVFAEHQPKLAKIVDRLETLREAYNQYVRLYCGTWNMQKRLLLRAGVGDPDEIASFNKLRGQWLESQRLQRYGRLLARNCAETELVKIPVTGRPRWFKSRSQRVGILERYKASRERVSPQSG